MTKPTLIDIYNFDRINHIETYLNKLQDKGINSLHNLVKALKVIENASEEMRKEITTLIDVYENSFFDMIMKGTGKDE